MKPIRRGLVVSIMAAGTFIPGMTQGQTPPPPPATPRAVPAPEAPEAPVAPTPRPAPRAYRVGPDGLEPVEVLSPRVRDALDSLSITPVAPGAYRLGLDGLEPMPAFHYMDAMPPMAAMAPMALSIPPLPPMEFAFAPQASTTAREQAERAREQADRAREQVERQREMIERQREMMDRSADTYLTGKRAIDNGDYERAIKYFDRVIEAKANNVEGAYYFKAYSLNKLGKRDEALAVLAELPKQFPQSKWLNDAQALKVEIQQPSPDSVSNEELKLMALNSLMNSDPERAVPLVDKVITDPKNPVQLKRRALFVLAQAQGRNEKARELMGKYAKSAPNPDIQYAAVTYLGQDRNKANRQILVEVYGSTNDLAIKRNVIKSLGDSRDSEHLLTLARGEGNIELRREAIRGLGNAQASAELSQLYASESNAELKEAILRSMGNSGAIDRLLELAKNERDLKLRAAAIRYLGNTRKEKSADALAGLYANETDKNLKLELMRALANQNSGKQLVDIARSEKDHELKLEVVKRLSNMRNNKEAQDYMMELLNK
ncbi:MAG TPA: HEAT repeat domain-containing protein [Bryobacteraceae bacterium]|nr:HEAT repeat domain-containing protein [Bryobacteraceae bacterium]